MSGEFDNVDVLTACYSIRYPDPLIKVNDTVKIDLATGKITDFIKFDTGVIAMATGGRNMGRVGVITHRERHDGGFNIVHIKDAVDNEFATRESNVFIIGREKPWISLPKGKGVKVRVQVFGLCSKASAYKDISFRSPRSVTVAGPMLLPATKRLARKEGSTAGDNRDGRLKVGVSGTILLHDGVANNLRSTDGTANTNKRAVQKMEKNSEVNSRFIN